jgi:hypothetical protein
MKAQLLLICALASHAATAGEAPDRYKRFKGEYSVYAGELGEQFAPTAKDRKISLIVSGQVAKDMFESMGPDDKTACSTTAGDRSRSKKNLWCTYSRTDGYTCYFGFDLRTGSSIPGGIC